MRSNSILIVTLFLCLFSFSETMAHGYWLEVEGNNKTGKAVVVKMFYGDYPVGERLSGKTLDKMKDIKVAVVDPSGATETITMMQYNDYWQGSFTPQKKGTYQINGINDEREVQDWTKHHLGIVRPIQYLQTTYIAGKASAVKPTLPLNASIEKTTKEAYEITVTKEGAALSNQKVVVAEFDKGESEFVTDANGKVTVPLLNKGIYILSIDWIDTKAGTFKEKPYESVRHRLDVSVKK